MMPTLPERYHNIHYWGNRSHLGRYYRHPATPPLRDDFEFITRQWTDYPTEQFFKVTPGGEAQTILLNAEAVSGSVKVETFALPPNNAGTRTLLKKTDALIAFDAESWFWEELVNDEGNVMAIRASDQFAYGMGHRITFQPVNLADSQRVPDWAKRAVYKFVVEDYTPGS